MCAGGNVTQTVGHTLSICHLEAALPLLEFSALLGCSRIPGSFFVIKGKVQVQV
jgi:hypothetical protein